MKLKADVAPLTMNKAWRGGRRFKSDEYIAYEQELGYSLKGQTDKYKNYEGDLSLRYVFYIKNYKRTDVSNLEKCTTDIIVRLGIIKDDRFIKDIYMRKEMSDKPRIEIEILPYKKIPQ